MTINTPSASKLARLRRDAKRLARQEGIPLHTAQQRLAVASGFANWSLMAKAVKGVVDSAKERTSAATRSARSLRWTEESMQTRVLEAALMQFLGHTSILMTLYYCQNPSR